MTLESQGSTRTGIVALGPQHVPNVASTHAICFPGYFLTNLGVGFLRLYYETCLEHGGGFGAVAVDAGGEVRGFAVGVPDLDHQDAVLFRRHPWQVAWRVAWAWMTSRRARAQVNQRFRRMGRVVGRIARHDVGARGTLPPEVPFATLTSLAVLPEERRTGLATRLVGAFEEAALQRGIHAVRVSTSSDDEVAVAFYHRNGWQVESVRQWENGVTFEKLLDTPQNASQA
jgi:ribosomal protein S18 acetylase RimI-like enzyme